MRTLRFLTIGLSAAAIAFAPCAFAQETAAQPPAAEAPAEPAPMFTVEQLRPIYQRTGSPCVIENARQFNLTDTRAYYELVCQGGYGEVAIVTLPLTDTSPVNYANCTLVASETFSCNLTEAEANRTWLDQRLASLGQAVGAGGAQCEATRFQYFPIRAANDPRAIEVSCSNRPESAVLLTTPTGQVAMSCARAWAEGFRCGLSEKETWVAAMNADLKMVEPDTGCQVSDMQPFGTTATDVYMEVTCSDGGRGFLVQYARSAARPARAVNCVLATQMGGGCRMPANRVPAPG